MKTAVIAFTAKGLSLAKKLKESTIYCYEKYADKDVTAFSSVYELVGEIFESYDGLLFIGAAAIAVRSIAPHLKSKLTDPAVLVADENADYCISLLSGHIGGANEWCGQVSQLISAVPVITTATDKRGCFAVDTFAVKNNMKIVNPDMIKRISGMILNGKEVGMASLHGEYKKMLEAVSVQWDNLKMCDELETGIQIVKNIDEINIFKHTLKLVPMTIAAGIGCRRGKSGEDIRKAVEETLKKCGRSTEQLFAVASIDRKADEEGIIETAKNLYVPFMTFSAGDLEAVQGEFAESDWVKSQVGVGNVCERSAYLATDGGVCLAGKTVYDGITVALYERRT
jgi:cobalt-precorrin 5A hydrolase